MHDVLVLGLVKLAIVSVIAFIAGFLGAIQESRRASNGGWAPIVKEPAYKRIWNRLRGRRSTSVEVREDRVRVHKKSR